MSESYEVILLLLCTENTIKKRKCLQCCIVYKYVCAPLYHLHVDIHNLGLFILRLLRLFGCLLHVIQHISQQLHMRETQA